MDSLNRVEQELHAIEPKRCGGVETLILFCAIEYKLLYLKLYRS